MYIVNQIKDFETNVCNPQNKIMGISSCNKRLSNRWISDKRKFDYSDYAKILDNTALIQSISALEVLVSSIEKQHNGDVEETYEMYLYMYKSLRALYKMATNVNNPACRFERISDLEVDKIINRMKEVTYRIEEVNNRFMMQD